MFSHADLEQVARWYVFGPEIVRRSVFNQKAELNRWLKSVGVLPVVSMRGTQGKVYDRAEFESVLHLQPKPLARSSRRNGRAIESRRRRRRRRSRPSKLA